MNELAGFCNGNLLSHCFEFLGAQTYLWLCSVSKSWRDVYLEVFMKKRFPWDRTFTHCDVAAQSVDLLRWSYATRTHFYSKARFVVCSSAALQGQFTVLKWARRKGYKLSAKTSANAAKAGRLDILQWLHAKRCRIGTET